MPATQARVAACVYDVDILMTVSMILHPSSHAAQNLAHLALSIISSWRPITCENFGCRATQADGAAIERQLLERGLQRAGAASEAEVVVLNTCTVTASADQDARAAIRRIHRENPDAQILVTGCYAQRAPEELSAIAGCSLVVGNSHKHELAEMIVSSAAVECRDSFPLAQIGAPRECQRHRRRHLRAHRIDGRAGLRRRVFGEDATQSESAGRLQ